MQAAKTAKAPRRTYRQRELLAILRAAGFAIETGQGKHSLSACHPSRPGVRVPLPGKHSRELHPRRQVGLCRLALKRAFPGVNIPF